MVEFFFSDVILFVLSMFVMSKFIKIIKIKFFVVIVKFGFNFGFLEVVVDEGLFFIIFLKVILVCIFDFFL